MVMSKHAGFSLIELMTALSVLGVILFIGVPGFQTLIRDSRSVTLTNDLISGLYLARSEASKRRVSVTLCRRNAAGDACASGDTDWSGGWLLQDTNAVIKVWDAAGGQPRISGPATGVVFGRDGRVGSSVRFEIQLAGCSGEGRRTVTVNAIGRVSSRREVCQ
jgi:type IV fimbrial biogenesis protein FimT